MEQSDQPNHSQSDQEEAQSQGSESDRSGDESSDQSSDKGSIRSSNRSSDRSSRRRYPRKGRTRIPRKLVSERAIIKLRYAYKKEGDTIIILKALGQHHIDELLRLSESYRAEEALDNERDHQSKESEAFQRDRGSPSPPALKVDSDPDDDSDIQSDSGFEDDSDLEEEPSVVNDRHFDVDDRFDIVHLDHGGQGRWSDSVFEGFDDGFEAPKPIDQGPGGSWEGQPLLHGFVNLRDAPDFWVQGGSSLSSKDAQNAWKVPRTLMSKYSVTAALSTIHSAEYYMDEVGLTKLTLCCPEGPTSPQKDESLVRMRWIHLQGRPTTLRIFEDLVTECPFLSQSLRSVALSLLLDVSKRCSQSSESGSEIQPGTVFRYIGRYKTSRGLYNDDPLYDTEPVIFTSTPCLALSKTKPSQFEKTLPDFLYGYNATGHGGSSSSTREVYLDGDNKPLTITVPQIWSLVVGSGILITFGDISLKDITADQVILDSRPIGSNFGVFTVRVVEEMQMYCHHVVIDRDCNFISFLKHVSRLARSRQTERATNICVLVNEDGVEVTPRMWIELLSTGEVERYVFGLRTKDRAGEPFSEDFESLILRGPGYGTRGHGDTSASYRFTTRSRRNLAFRQMGSYTRYSDSVASSIRVDEPPSQRFAITTRGFESPPANSVWPEYRRNRRLIPELFRLPAPSITQNDAEMQMQIYTHNLTTSDDMSDHLTFARLIEAPTEISIESMPTGSRRASTVPSASLSDVVSGTSSSDDSNESHETIAGMMSDSEAIPMIEWVPFLTWRLSWEADQRTPESMDQSLIQLLNKINTNLLVGTLGKQHRTSLQCTEADVIGRVRALSIAPLLATSSPPVTGANKSSAAIPVDLRNNLSDVLDTQLDFDGPRMTEHRVLEMLGLYRNIMDHFLPRDGSASIHPVCTRVWGALDTIIRQLHWAEIQNERSRDTRWIILADHIPQRQGDPGGLQGNKTHPSQCQACRDGKQYLSLEEAVTHVHKRHMNCSSTNGPSQLVDDPCVGWIKPIRNDSAEDGDRTRYQPFSATTEDFIAVLWDIHETTKSIHLSISGVGIQNYVTDLRPHLLSSLVHAFEKLMDRIVFQAKGLAWINLATVEKANSEMISKYLKALEKRAKIIDEEIQENLRVAKRDVFILGTTQRSANRLITASVGAEFLLTCLLNNAQQNALIQGTDTKLDIMRHCRRFTNELHFQSKHNPKRQRFLEISNLEEDLAALQLVMTTQRRLLAALKKMLEPASLSAATTEWTIFRARASLFRFESKHLDTQLQDLETRIGLLEQLQRRANAVRYDVKQSIEILEEGHGKAIRVFTIVTLFFLPLSFVTSFFGMNTVDVRDTTYNQGIFWAAALPMTCLVIAAALLYGYKWDEVVKQVSHWLSANAKSNSLSYLAADDITRITGGEQTSFNNQHPKSSGSSIRQNDEKARSSRRAGQGRWRRKDDTKGILRRRTGESLFL